ncbi:MAG TPA: transposase, partial [Lachnospiraceae bacterium]|nr:transposase [Lachnospiraceae bacterium]
MPRLDYYRKKTELSPLEQVENNHARRKIMQAVRAVEMHMALSCIAMGTVQCLSLLTEGKLCTEQIRYQRTPSKGKVSEGAMMLYLRKHIFRFMGQNPELHITRLIQEMQDQSEI